MICKSALITGSLATALLLASLGSAQDSDRDRGRNDDQARIGRLAFGTVIPVRTSELIESDKGDNRVYSGIVVRTFAPTMAESWYPVGRVSN